MKKSAIYLKIQNIPVFWQMLATFSCVLLMILSFHIISNQIYEKKLAENYLELAQENLNHNVYSVFQQMRMTSAIPTAVQATTAYSYLRNVTEKPLPIKYYSILSPVQDSLRNQFYLQGENLECLLYLSGTNTLCTRFRLFPVAEDCFDSYIFYEKTDIEELLFLLQQRDLICMLPAQNVSIQGITTNCLTLIIRPSDSNISTMTIYSTDSILERLGFNALPSGTHMRMEADGEILLDYPHEQDACADECYSISASDPYTKCTVTFYIPVSYFNHQLAPVSHVSLLMTLLIACIGFGLCILISKLQAKPIERLASIRPVAEDFDSRNELARLSHILAHVDGEISSLQNISLFHILNKIFSGGVLSEQEERHLTAQLPHQEGFRVAVLCARDGKPLEISDEAFQPELLTDFYTVSINSSTLGILFLDTEEHLNHMEALHGLLAQDSSVSCGISAPLSQLKNSYIAVRQAYLSLPNEMEIGIYTGAVPNLRSLSWLQHERLYHAILTNDKENAASIFSEISQSCHIGEVAKNVFLNVCFVIYSAAEELEVPFTELERLHYDPTCTAGQNMERLKQLLDMVFDKMKHKRRQAHDLLQEKILDYINKNCANYDMCAATVAEQFDLSEKNVYASVRQMTDMSFGEYLLSVRMQKAALLLSTTKDNIEAIAVECGYTILSTFYRAFKKYYGCAPAQYRSGANPRI